MKRPRASAAVGKNKKVNRTVWSSDGARFAVSGSLLLIFGAGDRDRTGDIQLGKLTFYH